MEDEAAKPQPKLKPVEMDRDEIPGFRLDRVGERQRLCVDQGADRIEIGAALREPDREWLYVILEQWRSPGSKVELPATASPSVETAFRADNINANA